MTSWSPLVRLIHDGDAVNGVLCGEPFTREIAWTGKHYEPYDPARPVGRAVRRVLVNLFDAQRRVMRVFEGSEPWFRDACRLRTSHPFDQTVFRIIRHGAAKSLRTRYKTIPVGAIDEDLAIALERADLIPLPSLARELAQPRDRYSSTVARPPSVTTDEALEILAALRALPRWCVGVFFREFGIVRVTQLAAKDLPRAGEYLTALGHHATTAREPASDRSAPAAANP